MDLCIGPPEEQKMDLRLDGKVAVVTGGSEGLGKAIALGLARENTKVAISGRRERILSSTAEEIIAKTGADVIALRADMTDEHEVNRFFDHVLEKWQTVDILINNVGCATKALFDELSEENWRNTLDANLFSAIFCVKRVCPGMRKQKWGRIVNIAAISGREPSIHLMASNVAKSGLISFSKSLSMEVAQDKILVNCVCPGRILTPQIFRLFSDDERINIAAEAIPMRRFGEADELSDLVVFLASERSSYITGTAIPVDGGVSKGLY
jgi:3-oxoacyl-[acyl-carrier protein] reductase